ncbi:MAG: chromosome segregation protein SMC [Peptococcaceae bacterium]|nr:chromosome segregation protein SMC [Peptococcaceae bacterium]
MGGARRVTEGANQGVFLKSIHIQGFKSFADKIKLDLQPGLCVIVGPNGSGKSNAADAVRWVLGEQSAKSLRGSKMEDIIFAGSSSRKPVGMAEVSLVFDNSKGLFPLAYEEVVITRRVFRDGEGQFLINKTPCRLKDIQELFLDTGSGKGGFSIIGQGRVEEILNLKSEERRLLIEEVAGISKFRLRKKETLNKLEDTKQNIDRLSDIISEVSNRLEPLAEQAEKAKISKELKSRLEETEIKLIVNDLAGNENKLKKEQDNLHRVNEELATLNTKIAEDESIHMHAKYELNQLDEQLEKLQGNVHTLENSVQENNHEISLIKERQNYTQEQMVRLGKEIVLAEEKIAASRDKYNSLTVREADLQKDLAQTSTYLEKMEQELLELRELSGGHRLEEYKTEIFQELSLKSKLTNELVELEQQKETLAKQETQRTEESTVKQQEKLEFIQQIEQQNKEILEIERLITGLEQRATDNKQAIYLKKGKQREIEESMQTLLRELDQARARRQALQNLEDNMEGYYKGVRETILAFRKGKLNCRQVYGTTAENLEVEAKYELAIETALGPALQNIIVDRIEDAQKCIAYLKRNSSGRATFLPLESIKGRKLSLATGVLRKKGVLGLAVDLITFDPRFQAVMEFLLGNIVITENLDAAIELAKTTDYRFRIVTLQGDQVNPGGSLTGGSSKGQGSGLLSRARTIEDLTSKINELKVKYEKQKQESIIGYKELEELKDLRRNLELQIKSCHEKKSIKLVDRKYTQEKLARWEEALKIIEFDLADIRNQNSTLDAKITERKKEIELTVAKIENLQREQKNLEIALEQADNQVEGLKERITAAKVEAARKEQEHNQVKQLRMEEKENLQNNIDLCQEKKAENNTLKQNVTMLNQKQEEMESKLQKIITELNAKKYKLIEMRTLREELNSKNIRLEEGIKLQYRKVKEREQQLHQNELRIARLQAEWETGCLRLEEEFNLSWEQALAYQSQDKKEVLQATINDLRAKIEELGPVNYAALEEYPQLCERYEFLSSQKSDLVAAADSLYGLINELDESMIKRFRQGFKDVNAAFSQVFNQLFNGGHAELQLDDPDNLLETGVNIIAQPPGKKAQLLSLLSGGERAFTAIALLFAFLKVKPSPFCLLDEIEAALDDANVKRFVNYLRTLSHQTQFILISHRRGTMESADRLYGITMEESGVSKLLTVEMDRLEHEIA